MKKSELFEAWKLNQWFYSFWLFVCLMCILNKHFYHSYLQKVKKIQKKKQDQPAPARIFCHKYYEQMMRFTMTLQFTVLESFQRITLKMRIQRDVVFFSNTSTHDGHWKGWMVHIKYHEEVEGQQKKQPEHMEKDEIWNAFWNLQQLQTVKREISGKPTLKLMGVIYGQLLFRLFQWDRNLEPNLQHDGIFRFVFPMAFYGYRMLIYILMDGHSIVFERMRPCEADHSMVVESPLSKKRWLYWIISPYRGYQ